MKTFKLSIILLACLGIVSCAAFKNGAPPTKFESGLYNVTTNYVPVVTTVTNPPTVAGQPPVVTTQTNQQPTYTYSPGPVLKDVETGVSLIPGYGTLASLGICALTTLWGYLRSTKNYNTGVNLAQSIETIREFLKALPNGTTYDAALTAWLQNNQAQTGSVTSVIQMLENDVSSNDAKIAAQQLISAIAALNPSAVPPGTAVKM